MNKGSSTEYFATVSADFMNKALPTFLHGECIRVHFPARSEIGDSLSPQHKSDCIWIGKHIPPRLHQNQHWQKKKKRNDLWNYIDLSPLYSVRVVKLTILTALIFHSDSPWVNQSGAALLLFHFKFSRKRRILRIKGREGDEKTRARLTLEPDEQMNSQLMWFQGETSC